jgi:L-malate glycosyltransferase
MTTIEQENARVAEVVYPPTRTAVFLMSNNFETGGSERQFAALAASLDPSRFRVELGCIAKTGDFLQGLPTLPVEFALGGNSYGIRSWHARARLARHMRRLKVSIAHAFDFYTNLTLIPAAKMADVPVVIGSQRQLGDLLPKAKCRAQLLAFRWCDCVVANSRAAADRLISHGIPASRVRVIHNGLPPSAFLPTAPALPRPPGVLRVGMIARMNTRSKNHGRFLRAAAELSGRFRNLEFVLVGDGPLRPEFEKQALDLGIGEQACFLGDRKDIPAVLASLDISVLPSESESLSNVIIESMASGVPVVATDVGGNSELLDDDRGILVSSEGDAALVNAIDHLLRAPERHSKLAHRGKEFAQKYFTLEKMQRQYEELYSNLLREKSGHRRTSIQNNAPSRTLRVAIVAPSMRYVGGQSVQADLLFSNWGEDLDVQAKMIPIDPDFPQPFRWAQNVPFIRTVIREPIYLWSLWRNLRNIDVVHIFSASYWSFLIATVPVLLIARLRKARTLIHYHSGEASDHLARSGTARCFLRSADELIVPSGYLANVFAEFALNAQVIPNIVDLSRFSFRIRGPLRPRLVCTRGFHPYYRVDIVLRAFAAVKQLYPDAHLDLVGGGPQEEEIRNLARQLNIADISFTGIIPHDKIAKFYDDADIFINASEVDNMPVSVLEAFASGTPVISTAPGGVRYIVEHERTGLLSEPGDAAVLACNVIRVLREPGLGARLARNARDECKRYTWEKVRGQWIEIYSSVAHWPHATSSSK